MKKIYLTVLFLFICAPVFAYESYAPATQAQSSASAQPSNLTLWNLFTEGWDQEWTKRQTPGGAPDMSLIHVTTNFLEREFRTDVYDQLNKASDSNRNVEYADALVAYGLNRRFMLEVESAYEWENARGGGGSSGPSAIAIGRLQLVDIPGYSNDLNLKITSPTVGFTHKQTTTISPAFGGWVDLTQCGLKRVGLYYSFGEETYVGPNPKAGTRNDVIYAVSLAKTWTTRDVPVFGNFSTFVEFYNTTNVDGMEPEATTVNMMPGIRMNLTHNNVVMFGVDLPIASPHAFNEAFRMTYIYDFE